VAIEYDVDGYIALNKIGVPIDVTTWLKEQSVTITVMPKSLKFVRKGKVVGNVTISWDMTKAIVAGQAIGQVDAILKKCASQILDIYSDLSGDLGGNQSVVDWANAATGGDWEPPDVLVDVVTDIASPETTKVKAVEPDWADEGAKKEMSQTKDMYALGSMETGAAVKLVNASLLYQPVTGSSNSSRYFCIGITDHVKIAARYRGTTLSLRVEGKVNPMQGQLKSLGFEVKKDGYMSVHLEVDNDIVAAKVIGSVLVGLAQQLRTPTP